MTETQTGAADVATIDEPTPDELIARARAMIPALRARSADTEANRRVPQETIDELKANDLLRIATPRRWGGLGYDLEVVARVAGEIARGCGSTGWLTSFWATHNYMVGWWSEEAQAEYFADGPQQLSSTVSAIVTCNAEMEPDGLHISGRWKFSSGIDEAQWILLLAPAGNCLIPRSEFVIEDDWYVSGLRGSGSKSIVIEGTVVPHHRLLSHEDLAAGSYPGAQLYDSPWYHVSRPQFMVLGHFILAPILGIAQGIVDLFDERIRERRDPQTMLPAIEREANQLRYAEATVKLLTAQLLYERNFADLRRWGTERAQLTVEQRAYIRRNLTYARKLAIEVGNSLIDGADSSALYEVHQLHRLGRDLRGAGLQFTLFWEEAAIQYSRVTWGMEPQTIVI